MDVIAVMDEPALVTFAPGRSNSPVPIEAAADAMVRVMTEKYNETRTVQSSNRQ